MFKEKIKILLNKAKNDSNENKFKISLLHNLLINFIQMFTFCFGSFFLLFGFLDKFENYNKDSFEKIIKNNNIIKEVQSLLNNNFKNFNENMSPYDIMANVGIKEKYRGKESLPYKNVIENINKITLEKSLKNKFEILTQSSLEMRNYILEYTSGKNELESMDDELPIIIYISTQVKIENLIAELNMIDDYIKSAMRDELIQNKMVTNILSSLLYIRKSWDIKLKTFTT